MRSAFLTQTRAGPAELSSGFSPLLRVRERGVKPDDLNRYGVKLTLVAVGPTTVSSKSTDDG